MPPDFPRHSGDLAPISRSKRTFVFAVFTIVNYVTHMDTAAMRQPDYLDLLKVKVDEHGGQNACSKATGIPQPTLNRKLTHKRGDLSVPDLNAVLRWLGTTQTEFWAEYEQTKARLVA